MLKATCLFVLCTLAANALANPTSRLLGGVEATDGQFPHQVSLRREGTHTCGGSILTRNFVLTAAHCVTTQISFGSWILRNGTYTIRAGSTNRLSGGVVLKVVETIVHEKYVYFNYDIALLRLESPLIFSKNIQPIQLPVEPVPVDGDVIISGWGSAKNNGDIPVKLQWNTLVATTSKSCGFGDTILCLSHQKGNGACNGDSGGPALYNGRLAGVSDFVIVACGTRFPDGYAQVYYHNEWIVANSDL